MLRLEKTPLKGEELKKKILKRQVRKTGKKRI